MAGDPISAPAPGEAGFTTGSFFLRLLMALAIVLLTFNPSGFSFFHWTRQSLGLVGVMLVAGLFAVLVWMLFFYDVVKTSSSTTLTWLVLLGVAVVLTVGISWAHLRRRLSGQATVDDIND